MKILTALSALQILAIAFLLVRVMSMDESIRSMAGAGQVQPAERETAAVSIESRVADSNEAADLLTAEQVRKIVREELRAEIGALVTNGATGVDPAPAPDPYDEVEYQQQYELVDQELEFFISQGTISDTDMATLQQEIAKLDPEGREEMLRRIVRALNSGELDGRL